MYFLVIIKDPINIPEIKELEGLSANLTAANMQQN